MDVSDVLRDRMQEPGGLQRMAIVSAAAHGAILALVLFAPKGLFGPTSDPAPKLVMNISLGSGTPGPQSGGLSSIGGKAVQEPAPDPAKREFPHPAAAKTPEMTVPVPNAKPTKAPPAVKQAPDLARGRTPSKGDPTPGTSSIETGVRGAGFGGLSTGGGNGSGTTLDVDVGTFCCPEYLMQSFNQIHANWDDQSETHDIVMVKFTIQRDGTLVNAAVDKHSRNPLNDNAALRAVLRTRKLVALPAEFPNPTLTIDLSFEYK